MVQARGELEALRPPVMKIRLGLALLVELRWMAQATVVWGVPHQPAGLVLIHVLNWSLG